MERILLVEPNYTNKYPPLGLMKIATYHRNKGDIVEFYKGEAPYFQIINADRIYITSLFTFHYDITVKNILHYKKYINEDLIFFGGIAATLMARDFERDTGIQNILRGQLLSSNILGYHDNINIDALPLDYDILDDSLYVYPAGDNYFIHTTRGCPRNCEFCAVRILEPEFITTNNILNQVKRIDEIYGQKRNLLIMDNNILCSSNLSKIIDDIVSLGFSFDANFQYPNKFEILMNKIKRRRLYKVNYMRQIYQMIDLLECFSNRFQRYKNVNEEYQSIVESIKSSDNILENLDINSVYLKNIFDKYSSRTKMKRYVDFNQGIDARLVNNKSMKQLAEIPVRPLRLAYDSLEKTDIYKKAFQIAVDHGVKHFSNYMLYNWKDKPEDLWHRLHIAISLYNKRKDVKGFSFPMKYSPIDKKDRSFIGEHWNKKFLGTLNIIINVTKGVVAQQEDFFYEAFGKNEDEFIEILTMPNEFIRFRKFFKENGLIGCWGNLYQALTSNEKEYLLNLLSNIKSDRSLLDTNHPINIKKILVLYSVNKNHLMRGEKTYESIVNEIHHLIKENREALVESLYTQQAEDRLC